MEDEEEVNLIVSATCNKPRYKPHPKVASKIDSVGAFSSIPPRVLLVKDVRSYIHCKIGETGDIDMYAAYQKLCGEDGKLKSEHKLLKVLGLMIALNFLKDFKSEWISVVLS